MSQTEIEKKYIVPSLKALPFDLTKFPSEAIYQGFYSGLPSPLRIRKVGEVYNLTKKFVVNASKNHLEEVTIPIKKQEFSKLFPVAHKKIVKTRFEIKWNKYTIELDIFKGKLNGLVIAEIEFKNIQDMEKFKKPDFLGEEITTKKWATNSRLALQTYAGIKKQLNKL
ncbi:MAG: hypothetical protein ABH810_03660 [bacterium]